MKTKFGISTIAIAALCGPMQLHAEPATPDNNNTPAINVNDSRYNNTADSQTAGKLERADKIIGREVKDDQDQKIGKIKDLAVDLKNGRIAEVIVARGGVLGVDEQLVAVPPSQLHCGAPEKAMTLNTDKARFDQAPTFKMENWDENVTPDTMAGVYHYYGAQPYFTVQGQAAGTQPNTASTTGSDSTAPNADAKHLAEVQQQNNKEYAATCSLGEVQRASKIIGSSVRNVQNERIGKIEDLAVDLRAGRVAEVIVGSGGFLGMGGELSAIPPQAFRTGNEADTLVLDTTKEALASAPHFKAGDWENNDRPAQVAAVYSSYNVEYYAGTNNASFANNTTSTARESNTAQNVRDRSDDALTPLKQGNSSADINTTRQIRKLIMAEQNFSLNARNIKIITIDGHVTLRGPVNTEAEKRRIAEIADQVASPANVDNQLQVEQSSPTSSVQ